MSRIPLILSSVIFILLIVLSLYVGKVARLEGEINEANTLSSATSDLLRSESIRCNARRTDFAKLTVCIRNAVIKMEFDIARFDNYNTKANETGALILENKGKQTYDGSAFKLKKNGVVVAQGCHIKTDILPDYTCRFPIEAFCQEGDVLDVTYEREDEGEIRSDRVATRIC